MVIIPTFGRSWTYSIGLQPKDRGITQERLVQNLQPVHPDENRENVPVDGLSDTTVLSRAED